MDSKEGWVEGRYHAMVLVDIAIEGGQQDAAKEPLGSVGATARTGLCAWKVTTQTVNLQISMVWQVGRGTL